MNVNLNILEFKSNKLITSSLFVLLFSIISCGKKSDTKHELSLDTKYLKIDVIRTIAQCSNTEGTYITNVISKKDGSLFFSQNYDYADEPFTAEITSDNKGYVLNENKDIIDTLSAVIIEMIRSHDFQRIQTNPNHFFSKIKFEGKVEHELELFSGIDRLNNPVKIYYNREEKQMFKIDFLNMMDTTEVIEIINKKWTDSEYAKLVKELEVIQAKKDTFYFNFEKIVINETD